MDTKKLNDWLQVVGLFGVIVSLVFVGYEIKQTREIAVSNIYQSRATASSEAAMSLAANQEAMRAFSKGRSADSESITGPELSAGMATHIGLMFLWDNSHFQNENGFMSDDHWGRIRAEIKSAMRVPFRRSFTERRFDTMRPSFRDEIREILTELEEETGE